VTPPTVDLPSQGLFSGLNGASTLSLARRTVCRHPLKGNDHQWEVAS
jgi:hypothetical protein